MANNSGLTQDQIKGLVDASRGRTQFYVDRGYLRGVQTISSDVTGAAMYLATIAYPESKDSKQKGKFYCSIMSMYIRTLNGPVSDPRKLKEIRNLLTEGARKAWFLSPLKDENKVQETINIGQKRLIKRFHAVHSYLAYDRQLDKEESVSFDEVLSKVSVAYESEHVKASLENTGSYSGSAERTRLENLRKPIREARPVLHLLIGLMEAREHRRILHIVELVKDHSWLEGAVKYAEMWLDAHLLEYEYEQLGGSTGTRVKFEPKEMIHVVIDPLL